MSRKTITVLSANGTKYWKYPDMNVKAKDYYHAHAKGRKCRHSFFKSLESLRIPHDGSLRKYEPTKDEINKIMNKKLNENPLEADKIREHFRAILDRIPSQPVV